jgi:hypothetical protein
MPNYNHLVEISEKDRRLSIYRIYEDNRKELFTEVDIPSKTASENRDNFEEFAHLLGENLLLDSPIARKLFDL